MRLGREDPGDPVGLRHHGGVAESVAEPCQAIGEGGEGREMLPMRNLITPQVNSEGLWTMMKVVEKEMKVPMMRTQLSSLLQALTTGVFQYLHRTPN